jgi:hypothetical protein
MDGTSEIDGVREGRFVKLGSSEREGAIRGVKGNGWASPIGKG